MDKTQEDDGTGLTKKQVVEVEESLACQRRIVEEVKAQGHDSTSAEAFLGVLVRSLEIAEEKAAEARRRAA